MDGIWIGRGPARFALSYRQYDVYRLDNLAPGEHVLAVLVQWSPDNRRSESVRPLLQGALQGSLPGESPLLLRTGKNFKAMLNQDVYLAQAELPAEALSLTFKPPTEGLTFAMSTSNLSGLNLPFQQGNPAGRRMLLVEPGSQPEAVVYMMAEISIPVDAGSHAIEIGENCAPPP